MVPIRHGGHGPALSSDNSLGLMLLVSVGIHIAVALLLGAGLFPSIDRDLPPVYTIDLTSLPVKNPQAGRPDGRPAAKQEEAEKTASLPKAEPPPPKEETPPEPRKPETAAPEPVPVPKKTVRETVVKPKPEKVEKLTPAKPAESYDDTLRKLAQMREKVQRQQEADDLTAKIAAFKTKDTRGGSGVPIGLPTARGTDPGVDEQTWIKAYIEKNWNLSKYQLGSRRDLEVKVRLIYDPQGTLLDYKFLASSRESAFDDSVRRAILKAKQLPFRPDRRLEVVAIFNLKDLMD